MRQKGIPKIERHCPQRSGDPSDTGFAEPRKQQRYQYRQSLVLRFAADLVADDFADPRKLRAIDNHPPEAQVPQKGQVAAKSVARTSVTSLMLFSVRVISRSRSS